MFLKAFGMEWLRMKKIFPICLMMKQLQLRPVGIWHTMLAIKVNFFNFFPASLPRCNLTSSHFLELQPNALLLFF